MLGVMMKAVVSLVLLVLIEVVTAAGMEYILCPGGEFSCPDRMTCCRLANKKFGCCPFPEATCCPDYVHCCPHNMKCDVVHQACLKNGVPVPFLWQVKVHSELVEKVEQQVEVAEQETLPETLGSNHLGDLEGPVTFTPAGPIGETDCPDGHHCPGSYTCCRMYRGDYGCCPYKDAHCCSDGFHCCPHNSLCDDTSGGCYRPDLNITKKFLLKKSILPSERKSVHASERRESTSTVPSGGEVEDPGGKCPDGHPCPEKFTCCKVIDQGYGCCPYVEARCCTDLIHCCPHGTNCNSSTGTCDVERSSWSVPSYSLVASKLSEAAVKLSTSSEPTLSDVVCPDRHSKCPDSNTCCKEDGRRYGCCPMPQATCCSDHLHCCPHGYKCHSGGCYKDNWERFLPPYFWDTKTVHNEQVSVSEGSARVETEDVVCPDHRSRCPDNNTCCEKSLYGFGCCPMPQATCCSDKLHCCPHGYRCVDQYCERLMVAPQQHLATQQYTLLFNATKVTMTSTPQVLIMP